MTTPTIVPAKYDGVLKPYLLAQGAAEGTTTVAVGTVVVPKGTEVGSYVGLVPFQKGTAFTLNDKSVHVGEIAGSATVDLGVIYADDTADAPTAFVSAASASAAGFLTIDEAAGLTLVTEADGWLALRINVAAPADDATVAYHVPLTRNVQV